MSTIGRRLTRLERAIDGCPTCRTLLPIVFVDDDGRLYPGSPPVTCPECGRERTGLKVIVGVDPRLAE